MVDDALSRRTSSVGSVTASVKEIPLARNVHSLANSIIQFLISYEKGA